MKVVFKLISFVMVCALCAGLLFVVQQSVFEKSTEAPAPQAPPIKSQKKAPPLEASRPVVAQQSKSIKRRPQELKLKPPSPIRRAYNRLKNQQIIVGLMKDKFFNTHRLWLPPQDGELYDVRQSQRPKAEHLHIHGPFGVYLMVISVFDKMKAFQALERELKAKGLFEDELKVLQAPRRRNTGFINESFYELPGRRYQVMMIGQHRETKKTILLRFRTAAYSRHVGQFINKRYRQIRVR